MSPRKCVTIRSLFRTLDLFRNCSYHICPCSALFSGRQCSAQPRIVSLILFSWPWTPLASHQSSHWHIVHPWIHSLRTGGDHLGCLQPSMEQASDRRARCPIWRGWSRRRSAERQDLWRGCRVLSEVKLAMTTLWSVYQGIRTYKHVHDHTYVLPESS